MAKDLPLDLELHKRLMDRDPTGLSRVIERFADPVIAIASRKYPYVPLDEIWTLLDDIFLVLHDHPEKYNPQKMRLQSYLLMALHGDLANHTRKLKCARPSDRSRHVDVELFLESGNNKQEAVFLEQLSQRETLSCVYNALRKLIPQDPEYTIASMVIEGIREREKYARILGIEAKAPEEIRSTVDKFKDRVKQKLKRNDWTSIIQKCKQS